LRFSQYVPDLPGGAVLLHCRKHPIGSRRNPIRIDLRADLVRGMKGGLHHGIHCLMAAENLGSLIAPTSPLFG
jgi:hypothetical protein